MNKLAQYLNQHLIGEVIDDVAALERVSTDNSPLAITPEMVAYPRSTSDVRKLLRFSAQLADKGHTLPVTPRGNGYGNSGGAIGNGLVVSLSTHMDRILELDPKQRLVRLQPGVTLGALLDALALHGLSVDALANHDRSSTLGGIVASDRIDDESEPWLDQVEIVLANGDILQTNRLSKKELHRKKGEEGFEADIYRAIDGLIDENTELVDSLDLNDMSGYPNISLVKSTDGSINLAPLFTGSQGTLGVISEMIIKANELTSEETIVTAAFSDMSEARDAIDEIERIGVSRLEYYDSMSVERAAASGKQFAFLESTALSSALLVITLGDHSGRAQVKKAKKLTKLFAKYSAFVSTTNQLADSEIAGLISLSTLALQPSVKASAALPILEGVRVPLERFEEFHKALIELSLKRRVDMAVSGRPLEGIWNIRPILTLKTVGGKQAVFKLIDDVADLAMNHGGYLVGQYGEGRLASYSAGKYQDDETKQLYAKIKTIFDPSGVLNNGVKDPVELRNVVSTLRSSYAPQSSDGLARS